MKIFFLSILLLIFAHGYSQQIIPVTKQLRFIKLGSGSWDMQYDSTGAGGWKNIVSRGEIKKLDTNSHVQVIKKSGYDSLAWVRTGDTILSIKAIKFLSSTGGITINTSSTDSTLDVTIDITPTVGQTTSASSAEPNSTTQNIYTLSALAVNTTFAIPSGTAVDGRALLIRVKDDGTPRTLTWNSIYRASTDFSLPTTTVANKWMYIQFIYNDIDDKWDAVGLTQGF